MAVRRATCSSRSRDAYARRDARAQLRARAAARVPRLVGGRRLRLPAARADPDRASPTRRSRRTRRPTGTSPRTASSRTARPACSTPSPASCGLAAMLWLYGVAWHQPMAESIAWARDVAHRGAAVGAVAVPERHSARGVARPASAAASSRVAPAAAPAPPPPVRRRRRAAPTSPIDPDSRREFAERRARVAVLKVEGPRMLQRRQLAARGRALPRVDRPRPRQRRGVALPRPGAAGAGLPPGRDQRVPQGEAVRSERPHARRRDRPQPERHRRRLPQPAIGADASTRLTRRYVSRRRSTAAA